MKVNKNEAGFTLPELIIAIAAIGSLALFGTGLYVVFHFVQKFW